MAICCDTKSNLELRDWPKSTDAEAKPKRSTKWKAEFGSTTSTFATGRSGWISELSSRRFSLCSRDRTRTNETDSNYSTNERSSATLRVKSETCSINSLTVARSSSISGERFPVA